MPTESGNRKITDNYRQLIDHVTADANYNPADSLITKAALATHYTAVNAALDAVDNTEAPYRIAINKRQETFDPVTSLIRRSFAMMKASGASQGELDDAQTEVRKITGARKSPKIKADPKTPANEAGKQHSASQICSIEVPRVWSCSRRCLPRKSFATIPLALTRRPAG